MFPYRRGGKKRGKGNGGGGGRRFEPGRRPPAGVHELLAQMQPATKALAQALAQGARISGQLGHARHLLAQAERIVEDQGIDRLAPAQREEFLEQLARLKLTVADADGASAGPAAPAAPQPTAPAAPIAKERLRELALSLAAATRNEPPPAPVAAVEAAPAAEAPPEPARSEPAAAGGEPTPAAPPGSPRAARLRLKTTVMPRAR
jgi:hypothetical protein